MNITLDMPPSTPACAGLTYALQVLNNVGGLYPRMRGADGLLALGGFTLSPPPPHARG